MVESSCHNGKASNTRAVSPHFEEERSRCLYNPLAVTQVVYKRFRERNVGVRSITGPIVSVERVGMEETSIRVSSRLYHSVTFALTKLVSYSEGIPPSEAFRRKS